jgi:branched-chain amino acid transport system ATP-binding protein
MKWLKRKWSVLDVAQIETFYGTSQALFGISLMVREGQVAALLGRNGMGKSTTLRSIMGLTPIRAGRITFYGREIHRLPDYAIARSGIGLVPEGRQIFPNLTVAENMLATATRPTGHGTRWTLDAIYDLFPALKARQRHFGNQLSGGEQQMLAIGRALMTHPRLLLLDEATEGLAPKIRSQIWRSLEILKQQGLSILVVDKNVDALMRICDRLYVIQKGRNVWQGTPAQFKSDPTIRQNYLGI